MSEEQMPTTESRSPRQRVYDISADLTMLIGMIEGVAVIYDAVENDSSRNPVAKRAANAMIPMLDNIIVEANRINNALDELEQKGFENG